MSIVVIDTETTGFKKPVVPVETALLTLHGGPRDCEIHDSQTQRWNPGKEIEFGAMSTHLITNWDLTNARPWAEFEFPSDVQYIVGHSVDYDWEALGSPNVKRICTNALSRAMWPDADSHKLGALLLMTRGQGALGLLTGAHGAYVDARNVVYLIQTIANTWDIKTWDELWTTSEIARMPVNMPFGQYGPKDGNPGMPLDDMCSKYPDYVQWMFKNVKDMDPYLRKALEMRV